MSWTIAGKTALVTGATRGLGLETSAGLAQRGARVLMVGRDRARLETATAHVHRRVPGATLETFVGDFASLASIRRLADDVRARHDRLDVLVNNAGAVHKHRRVSADGIEMTFAVNHLGYFLLTNLLLDLLVRSAPARIVTVASIAHREGALDFEDLGLEHGYGIMRAYSRSKLANVLFATELARRLAGTGVTSNSVHPGTVATNIWTGAPFWAKPFIYLVRRPFFLSVAQGVATILQLAADPSLENTTGEYFEHGVATEPAPMARDTALARRLWDVSAALTRAR